MTAAAVLAAFIVAAVGAAFRAAYWSLKHWRERKREAAAHAKSEGASLAYADDFRRQEREAEEAVRRSLDRR